MPVRVKELATGKVAEVPSAVAARGLGTEYELVDPKVRVILPDGRTGRVPRSHVQQALGAGYKLADEAEVADQKLRNDANTAASNAIGVAEQFASGVTLGASDLALEAVGVDPAAMRAREDALGAVGTAARLAGEVAPALLTGGGSAATSTAGRVARVLPGAMLDTAAARIGGRSLAARGAVEGFGYGVGQQVHESVLGETPLNAEHLLAGGFTTAVLGGGGGAVIGGLGKLASTGSRKLTPAVETVLSRMDPEGVGPGSAIAEAIAGKDGVRAKSLLLAHGMPEGEAQLVAQALVNDPSRLFKASTQGSHLDDELAGLVRDELNPLQATLKDTLFAVEGAAKYRSASKLIPRETAEQAMERSAKELSDITAKLDAMELENARKSDRLYHVGTLREAQAYARRAEAELYESADPGVAFEAMDKFKRDLGALKIFKDPGDMSPSGLKEVRGELKTVYTRVQQHLENKDLWSAMAERQAEINARASAKYAAEASFAGEHGRGAMGQIWNRETGEVNTAVSRRIARTYGRKSATEGQPNRLANLLEARVQHLEAYAKHTDLPPELRARVKEARATKERLEAAFAARAEDAAVADGMRLLRDISGDGSPSIGALSSALPVIGGLAGSMLGPLGAAAGVVLGQLARPYTLVRGLAGILHHIDGAAKRIGGATGRTRAKLFGQRAGKAARAAGRAGRKVGTAAATHADREETMKRVRQLARDPDALAQALDVPTYDLRQHAPNLERMAGQKLLTAAQYLIDQEPKKFTTPFGTDMVDPTAEREFKQCYDAVMDPIGVLELLPEGLFTSKHAHALQAVYPEIWNGVRLEVTDALITAQGEGKHIPLDVRSSVGIALGLPTDVGLQPGMATELAMRHAGLMPGLTPPPVQGEAPGTKRPRKARAGDIKRTINTYRTPLERTQVE